MITHKRYTYICISMYIRQTEKRRVTYVPTQAEALCIKGQIGIIPLMHTLETRIIAYKQETYVCVYASL